MPSELPRFAFIYGHKCWSVDFKIGKDLKYLTGVVQIFLLTLSSLGSSAHLDLIFSPLILAGFFFSFFFYMTLYFLLPPQLNALDYSVSLSVWNLTAAQLPASLFPLGFFFLSFCPSQLVKRSTSPASPSAQPSQSACFFGSWTPEHQRLL